MAQPRPHEEPQEGVPLSVWAAVRESALMVEHLGCFCIFFAISNKALLIHLIDYPYTTSKSRIAGAVGMCIFQAFAMYSQIVLQKGYGGAIASAGMKRPTSHCLPTPDFRAAVFSTLRLIL